MRLAFRVGIFVAITIFVSAAYIATWHRDTFAEKWNQSVERYGPSWLSGSKVAPSAPNAESSNDGSLDLKQGDRAHGNVTYTEPVLAADPPLPTITIEVAEKVVVMARLDDKDTSWVDRELPGWTSAVYVVDNTSAPLHTSQNKGREAQVYLTYVVENYDFLPEIMAFIHPHKDGYPAAWHNDVDGYSAVTMLQTLRTEHVKEVGFANLRCNPDPGCPAGVRFDVDPTESKPQEKVIPEVWPMIFPDIPLPDEISTPCCAQFAVTGAKVRERPKQDYQKMLSWLLETPYDDYTSGRVFEYMWHLIYGQPAIYCRQTHKCYCDVYGRC